MATVLKLEYTARNVSLRKLGKLTGIEYNRLSRIACGWDAAFWHEQESLAEALGLGVAVLFDPNGRAREWVAGSPTLALERA